MLFMVHKKKVGGSGIVFVLVKTLQKTLQQSAIMRRRHRPTRAKRTTPPLSMPTTIGAPHKTRCKKGSVRCNRRIPTKNKKKKKKETVPEIRKHRARIEFFQWSLNATIRPRQVKGVTRLRKTVARLRKGRTRQVPPLTAGEVRVSRFGCGFHFFNFCFLFFIFGFAPFFLVLFLACVFCK